MLTTTLCPAPVVGSGDHLIGESLPPWIPTPGLIEAKESILGEVGSNGEAHHIVAISQVAKKPLV